MVIKKAPSFNKEKLAEKIHHELSGYLRKELADPKIQFVSLVKVELNKDSSVADVYWDTFDSNSRGDCKVLLETLAPKMRKLLAKNMQLRHTPEIRLFYFSQYEDEHNIEKLLMSEKNKND